MRKLNLHFKKKKVKKSRREMNGPTFSQEFSQACKKPPPLTNSTSSCCRHRRRLIFRFSACLYASLFTHLACLIDNLSRLPACLSARLPTCLYACLRAVRLFPSLLFYHLAINRPRTQPVSPVNYVAGLTFIFRHVKVADLPALS